MRVDGDGRFCDRCSLHVTNVASLDEDDLARLLADGGRICARFELERGHPRTKFGIAAGFVVAAPTDSVPETAEAELEWHTPNSPPIVDFTGVIDDMPQRDEPIIFLGGITVQDHEEERAQELDRKIHRRNKNR